MYSLWRDMIINTFVAHVWLLPVVLISYSPKLGYTKTPYEVSWNIKLDRSVWYDLINADNHDTIQVLLTSCINLVINYVKLLSFDDSFVNLNLMWHVNWVCKQISTNKDVVQKHHYMPQCWTETNVTHVTWNNGIFI